MAGKNLARVLPVVNNGRGTAHDVILQGCDRRAGLSRGAAELLAVLREERRRRASSACVPSVERLARLCGVASARTIQRRLAELSAAGVLLRAYRGGRGKRSMYYVRPPSSWPVGRDGRPFRELGGARPELVEAPAPELVEAPAPELVEAPAPELVEAPAPELVEAPAPELVEAPAAPCKEGRNPATVGGVTGVASTYAGKNQVETQSTGGARAASAASVAVAPESVDPLPPPPPSPRAGGTSGARRSAPRVSRSHLALVWGVWRRVWSRLVGRGYQDGPRDAGAALWLARRFGALPNAEHELAWHLATHVRNRGEGAALWRAAADLSGARRAPPGWNPATLRTEAPRAPSSTSSAAQGSSAAAEREAARSAGLRIVGEFLARHNGGGW